MLAANLNNARVQVELKLRSIHDKLDEIGKHQSYCKKKVYNALGKIMSYQSRFAVFRVNPNCNMLMSAAVCQFCFCT